MPSHRWGKARAADRVRERRSWSGLLVAYAVGLPLLHMAMSWSGMVDPELHSGREILVFLSALLLGGIALTYQRILERDNRRLEEKQRLREYERWLERVDAAKRRERERAELMLLQVQETVQESIPAHRASGGAHLDNTADRREVEEAQLPDAQSRPKHGPVLIVDHRTTISAMLKSALERGGFSVLLAEDGKQAVKILHAEDVSAVLLESTVPGVADGAVLEEMQRANPDVPVLLMQGAGQSARKVGGDEGEDVLETPFGPQGVLTRLRA